MSTTDRRDSPAVSPGDTMPVRLGDLWEAHRPTIVVHLDALDDAVMGLIEGNLAPDVRQGAERAAHQLGGAVGTFGFIEASRQARTFESLIGGPGGLEREQVLQLADLAVALRVDLDRPLPGHATLQGASAAEGSAAEGAPGLAEEGRRPQFLVVSDDTPFARKLEVEAASRGISARTASLAETMALAPRLRPSVLLLDLSEPEKTQAGLKVMDFLNEWPGDFSIIVLTTWESFADRIEAVRRGADVFLHRPISHEQIIGVAQHILAKEPEQTPHVVIVDDDWITREMVAAVLEPQPMDVTRVASPSELWNVLRQRPCDLLILDVSLPDANGVELCRALRADPHFESLPIMFLTSYEEPKTIQALFDAGADDYVQKPFAGPDLVSRVTRRIERTRKQRARSSKDALTGLLTAEHACTQAELLFEFGRHLQQPVSIALVRVVTQVEASASASPPEPGDAVLQQMARLLGSSFQRLEVLGRFSRATFLLALVSNVRMAARRLEPVLSQFKSAVLPVADGAGGAVSTGAVAGLAEFPSEGWELEQVLKAAGSAVDRAAVRGIGSIEWAQKGSQEPALDGVDVVIVDDDALLVDLLTHSLRTRGVTTRSFSDGQEALDALASSTPTVQARVVLLDVVLPSLDGLTVLRHLSREGLLRRTRVIMLTFRDTEAEVLQALNLGAFDHVSKPFSLPILLHRIRRALVREIL